MKQLFLESLFQWLYDNVRRSAGSQLLGVKFRMRHQEEKSCV